MRNFAQSSLLKMMAIAVLLTTYLISCKEKVEMSPNNGVSAQNKSLSKAKVSFFNFIEDETVKGDFELRDGILHFKNAEIYFKYLEKFGKMEPQDRLEASKALGLTSLLEIQDNFTTEIDKAKNKTEFDLIKQKYNDIIITNNDFTDFINVDRVSAALIDRKGLVYLGKSLRRYKGNEQTNVANGDVSLLDSKNNSELVMTHQYITKMNSSNGRIASTCSNYLGHKSNGDFVQYDYFGGTFVGGGDRGIVLDIYNITDPLGGGSWNVHAYEVGTPYKKPVSWSGFYQYKTNNTLYSRWQYSVTENVSNTTYTNYAFNGYSNDYSLIDYDGNPLQFTGISSPSFTKAYDLVYYGTGIYYSQGVGYPGIEPVCP